jgi:hypothetical protein
VAKSFFRLQTGLAFVRTTSFLGSREQNPPLCRDSAAKLGTRKKCGFRRDKVQCSQYK